MDSENLAALRQRFGDATRLHRLLDFAGHTAVRDVPDPYYGGEQGFELVLDMVEDAGQGLIRALQRTP